MEFDKFAYTYQKYNIIQKEIIKYSLKFLNSKIIDLGCGSEGLCKYKKFDFYLGIDNSPKMLRLNPCNTLLLDFNTKECFETIKKYDFNQIVSLSALQWAKDLNFIFNEIKQLKKSYFFAIFTSNTFKSLHNFLDISSPIYSKEEILNYANILNPKIEILNKTLFFKTPKELLNYIKYSGVKGKTKANISKLKKFYKYFPINKLEFEIIILKGNLKD
jgi:malonyl-CoA O-methyltransferase